jgi:hypothetical protein
MSLLWMDGFDYYTQIPQQYETTSLWGSGFSIDNVGARNGSQGVHITNTNARWFRKNIATNSNTMFMGAAIFVGSLPSSPQRLLVFLDTGTYQVEAGIDSAGRVRLTRNGTLLATSSLSVSPGVWNYWEFKAKIASSGSAEIRINGVSFVSFSGNTQNTANASANQVQWGPVEMTAGLMYIDDVYLLDSSGTQNNNYLGDVKVLAAFPSANGAVNNFTQAYGSRPQNTALSLGYQIMDSNGNIQEVTTAGTTANNSGPSWNTVGGGKTTDGSVVWTCRGSGSNPGAANWMAVSELAPDDDSSYVVSGTVGNQELYTISGIAGATIFGTMVSLRADKDDASTRSVRSLVKSGATVVDNGVDYPLTQSSYAYFNALYPLDPNTGSPWTPAALSAAQIGVKVTA